MDDTNSLIEQRKAKLKALEAKGIFPFRNKFTPTETCQQARAHYAEGRAVAVAGRITAHRDMGKSMFIDVRDQSGRLQVYAQKNVLGDEPFLLFTHLDLGDFVGVKGTLFTTKTGEISVKLASFTILAKALRPPPGKWHGLEDTEIRYRQRYLDLLSSKAAGAPPLPLGGAGQFPRPWERERVADSSTVPLAKVEGRVRVEGGKPTDAGEGAAPPTAIATGSEPGSTMDIMLKRSAIVREIRDFFHGRGYVEVETPMMQAIPGGAAAQPFKTYHNALGCEFYLRIALELYHKRLLVGGIDKLFEIGKNFRNEGLSRRHNPEFTMLEAYCAYGDYETMMETVESLITTVAQKVLGTLVIEHRSPVAGSSPSGTTSNIQHPTPNIQHPTSLQHPTSNIQSPAPESVVTKTINLTRPWRRAKYQDLVREKAGADWFEVSPAERRQRAHDLGAEIGKEYEDFEVTGAVFEKLIEPTLINPTFVTHLPKELVPLAKLTPDDPATVEVFECCINGQEISPGYTEQNDPVAQRATLEHQAGGEQQKLDEDFLVALEHGMPPAGGIGIGIDRLCMMLLGQESIRDVILFPQLKPK